LKAEHLEKSVAKIKKMQNCLHTGGWKATVDLPRKYFLLTEKDEFYKEPEAT
jgi:hypothetical protein